MNTYLAHLHPFTTEKLCIYSNKLVLFEKQSRTYHQHLPLLLFQLKTQNPNNLNPQKPFGTLQIRLFVKLEL